MKNQYLVASFIISSLFVPGLASAQSASDIQAQIQSLLSQISALQAQLSNLPISTTITTSSDSCPNLYRMLSRGSRGSDVIALQKFLISEGLMTSDAATGFFGPMTEAAVQRWQAQNSIVASGDVRTTGYGVVGARTRAAITARCGMATASISVTVPQIIDYIDRGSELPIEWIGRNAPSISQVYLTLVRADGRAGGGIIAGNQLIAGTYTWRIPRIPAANDEVAITGGDYRLRGADITSGVSYKVRATIYMPTTVQCIEGCPPSMGTAIISADSGTFVVR
jgi:peptidoglycan hydrolase-like protein with peptidoglycan-binding domain